jgi:hypothetical protein
MKRQKVPKTITLKLDAQLTRRLVIYDRILRFVEDPKKSGSWTNVQMVSVLMEMAGWREDLAEGVLRRFNDKYPVGRFLR